MSAIDKIKCTSCNDRNGNTRCEGCNTLFCLPCMNKHHDELAQQFQLLTDVRNEVKQSLEISQSKKSSSKQASCLVEIDTWERETIQRVQQIATNARTSMNELIMKRVKEISDRLQQISIQMEKQQKQGDFLENDIERIKNQLNQFKNDIRHMNENIRVDSSLTSDIAWDTLIYIVEGDSPSKATTPFVYDKDEVIIEKKKSISVNKVKEARRANSSSRTILSVNPLSRIPQRSSTPESIERPSSSSVFSIERENQSKSCIECSQPFVDWEWRILCPKCRNIPRFPAPYEHIPIQFNTRSESIDKNVSTDDRDDTTTLSSKRMPTNTMPVKCSNCQVMNFIDDISSNSDFLCRLCELPMSTTDRVAQRANNDKKVLY